MTRVAVAPRWAMATVARRNTARTILLASAAVARARGQIAAAEVIDGLAGALGEHVDEFVAENEGKTV